MNARVNLPEATQVCPTLTRRKLDEGEWLVDVRERAEVERMGFDVPELVAIPMSELAQRFAELPRDRDLVIACQSGPRSLKATCFLMYQGYARVANMEGGLDKWARKGFPVKGGVAAAVAEASCCGDKTQASTSPCCVPQTPDAASCCASNSADCKAISACPAPSEGGKCC